MKKRILALSLAAAMVVGALASCTATTEPVSSTVETRDITLTLWGSEQDQAFLKEVSAAWAEQYAKDNEDVASVKVDVQIKGEDVATTDALNDISAAADVFGIGNDQLGQLTAANAIYKMPDSVVSEIKDIVGDGGLAATMYDGNYYGFPYEPNTANILYYNTSLYTEDEVKDLQTMLDKDLGAGVTNVIAPLKSAWDSMTWFASAGAELYTGGDKSVNTLNSDAAVQMMDWLQQQIDSGKISNVDSNTDAAALLEGGKVGALFYQDWDDENYKKALGDNYGVVELPTLNGNHMKCFGGGKLYVLNANTKEPEAALALAQYIISEDSQLKKYQMSGKTPTAVNLATNAEIAADPKVAADIAQGAYTITSQPLNGDAQYWTVEAAFMTDLVEGKIKGTDAIKEKLDEMVNTLQTNVGA